MKPDKLIIYPSRWKLMFLFLVSVIMLIVGQSFLISLEEDENVLSRNLAGWFFISFSILSFFTFVLMLFMRLPKLILDSYGVHFKTIFRTRTWRWSEVGPFSVHYVSAGRGGSSLVLCAYTDENYDLMAAHGIARRPSAFDADVQINLSLFPAGSTQGKADQLAETVNQWREKFGSPELNVDRLSSKSDAENLAKKKQTKFFIVLSILIGMGLIGSIMQILLS